MKISRNLVIFEYINEQEFKAIPHDDNDQPCEPEIYLRSSEERIYDRFTQDGFNVKYKESKYERREI